jgi:hypothetical protein
MKEIYVNNDGESQLLKTYPLENNAYLIINNLTNIQTEDYPTNVDILGNFVRINIIPKQKNPNWYELQGEWYNPLEVSPFKIKIHRDSVESINPMDECFNVYNISITIYKKQFEIKVIKSLIEDYKTFLKLIYNILTNRYK